MQKQTILGTALAVSPLCFGCGNLGAGTTGENALRLVETFFAAGGNFFDTAHCYAFWDKAGAGASEKELGRCLRELNIHDRCVVATKGGHPAGPGYPHPADFLSEQIIHADIDDSLNRLQLDFVDLFYLHRDDGKTPVGEIIERLNREIQQGRVRFIGASNWSVARIAEANAYAIAKGLQGFVISQVQGSLAIPNGHTVNPGPDPVNRTMGNAEMKFHSEAGLPIAAYSATVSGYFAGSTSGNALYDNPENQARRERAKEVGREIGATPTQVALAWLRHLPATIFPIFATNQQAHLAEIIGAMQVTLTPEQVRYLREGQ